MSRQLRIFSGTANLPLSIEIAKYCQVPLGKIHISNFKDGEIYVRVGENVRGKDVFVIQPTSKYVNRNLMEMAIIIDAMKRASARRVTAVIPYYGYARQDRKAKEREPITAKLVANLLTAAGADRVLTIDLHSGQIQGFFDIPLDHLTALSILANFFIGKKIKNITVVAPDAGSVKTARILAKILSSPLAIIDKRRGQHNKVAEMNVIGDVDNSNCILVDDIIDTGGTVIEAAKALSKKGARDIYVAATHAVLSDPATKLLDTELIKDVVVTDTILTERLPKKITKLSVAPLLGEAIKRINKDESVSKLFQDIINGSNKNLKGY